MEGPACKRLSSRQCAVSERDSESGEKERGEKEAG